MRGWGNVNGICILHTCFVLCLQQWRKALSSYTAITSRPPPPYYSFLLLAAPPPRTLRLCRIMCPYNLGAPGKYVAMTTAMTP